MSEEDVDQSKGWTKFNLKDEGIPIEKIYVNSGFAEYQHDIGKSNTTINIKSFILIKYKN